MLKPLRAMARMCRRTRMDATRSDDHGAACTAELVRELGLLRARNAELAAELEKAALDREFLRTELEKTKHQLAKLLRQRYGKKAETVDLPLFAHLVATEAAKSEAVSEQEEKELRTWIEGHHRTRRKRGQRYENLPEKVRQVELTEEQRKCSCCGEQRMRIGEERHTRLEYKPAEVWRETTVQGKYACPFCPKEGVETAPVEPPAVPRCLMGTGLMSAVVVNKYCHHLPLYRQEAVFAATGLGLGRSLMCDGARLAADAANPLWGLLRKQVRSMAAPVEWRVVQPPRPSSGQEDETPVKVLRPGDGKAKEARMWIHLSHGPDPEHERKYAVFEYTESRAGRWPLAWFDGWEGNLQADAYPGFDALYRGGRIVEHGCMAHARRYFVEALDVDRETCTGVLAMIRELYAVEHAAEQRALELAAKRGAALVRTERCAIRHELRQERAVPVLERLRSRLDALADQRRVLPKSPVGRAVEYARSNWAALSRYAGNGAVEIDNNSAERMLRPIAVGRRNWIHLGSDQGGETAAILFSVLGSARLHEIEPWAYMRAVLERVPRARTEADLMELLPDRWIAANPGHRLPMARSNKGW